VDASALDAQPALGEEADRLRHQPALHGLHPRRQRLRRVALEHRHRALQDDRPVIVLLVHEVHGRAAHAHAGGEHRLVDAVAVEALAAEGRDQRGMDVDRAAREAARLERREEAEARHQVHRLARELRVQGVVEGAQVRELLARHRQRADAPPPGAREAARAALRGEDQHDLRGQRAVVDALAEVLEARALAGEQHRDAQRLAHPPNRLRWMRRVAGDWFRV